MGCPSSHKGLKELFFFMNPSFPFTYPTEWLYVLPPLPLLECYRESEDYKLVISLLNGQVFHLGRLLYEKTLARVGLSPSPLNPTISLGRFHHYYVTPLTRDHILT